jgi:3,4-dihydroxy 2-butanone 4-phosphate synthase / GTP cyclohydrolase II
MVFVVDPDRPDHGAVLTAAAERVNEDIVNVMVTFARGLLAVAITPERAERLSLATQGPRPTGLSREHYTVSVEAKAGISTGISAADRARTIQVLADRQARPIDLVCPGHVFPSIAHPDGVLKHPGWSEAVLDLAQIAGLRQAMAFCHVLDEEGEHADEAHVRAIAADNDVPVVTLRQLIAYRRATESVMTQVAQRTLETRHGSFLCRVFENRLDNKQHVALSVGDVRTPDAVLVRLHSECLTGDVLGSMRCDCGAQLATAMARLQGEGRGVLLYLRQEGRGIGLAAKIAAYALQDQGRDTVEANLELGFEADQRDFTIGAQMLAAIGVRKVRLMTNNPRKISELGNYGVVVDSREPIEVDPSDANRSYLATKKAKLGHLLDKV